MWGSWQQWPNNLQPLLSPVALHKSTGWSSYSTGFPNRSSGRINQITFLPRGDFGKPSSPSFCLKQGQNWIQVRLFMASSNQILKSSKERDFITSLVFLIQCLIIFITITFSLYVVETSLHSIYDHGVSISYHKTLQRAWLCFLCNLLLLLLSLKPCLLQAEMSSSPSDFLDRECSSPQPTWDWFYIFVWTRDENTKRCCTRNWSLWESAGNSSTRYSHHFAICQWANF